MVKREEKSLEELQKKFVLVKNKKECLGSCEVYGRHVGLGGGQEVIQEEKQRGKIRSVRNDTQKMCRKWIS